MSWLRVAVTLVALALGSVAGSMLVGSCGLGGDCDCREPRPLVQGNFRVTDVERGDRMPADEVVQTGTLTIAPEGIVVVYTRDAAEVRVTYDVASRYDLENNPLSQMRAVVTRSSAAAASDMNPPHD